MQNVLFDYFFSNSGLIHRSRPWFSVQFHPEASPGPHASSYLFDAFVRMMAHRGPVQASDFGRESVGAS